MTTGRINQATYLPKIEPITTMAGHEASQSARGLNFYRRDQPISAPEPEGKTRIA